MSIRLHPEKGVNPRLTFCVRCGGEGRDLILIGTRECKTKCPYCDTMNFGLRSSDKCGECNQRMLGGVTEKLEDDELLPGGICEVCEKEKAEHRKVVEEGGILFKCECGVRGVRGVVKADSQLAKDVREKVGIKAPEPCGIEFKTCHECSDKVS